MCIMYNKQKNKNDFMKYLFCTSTVVAVLAVKKI